MDASLHPYSSRNQNGVNLDHVLANNNTAAEEAAIEETLQERPVDPEILQAILQARIPSVREAAIEALRQMRPNNQAILPVRRQQGLERPQA